MEMDAHEMASSSAGRPLHPLPPERVNKQPRPLPPVPNSPSLPELGDRKRENASEVQHKIAQYNTMGGDRKKASEAALRRALIGREEVDTENHRLRDRVRALEQERSEGRRNERRAAERIDTLMEDVIRYKDGEHHAREKLAQVQRHHEQSKKHYDLEYRRARKEAFKSSSALVKLHEELKAAQNEHQLVQEALEQQRSTSERHEKTAFKAEYQLLEMQQQLDDVRREAEKVEEERDAIRASLKEEEIARVAAEGKLSLPQSQDEDEEIEDGSSSDKKKNVSKKKQRTSGWPFYDTPEKEGEGDKMQRRIAKLRFKLNWERSRVEELKGMVDFMNMECQFKCCPCRRAERNGREFVHDKEYAQQLEQERRKNEPEAAEKETQSRERGKEEDTIRLGQQRRDSIQSTRTTHEEISPETTQTTDEDGSVIWHGRPGASAEPSPERSSRSARHYEPDTPVSASPSPSPKKGQINEDDTFSAIPFQQLSFTPNAMKRTKPQPPRDPQKQASHIISPDSSLLSSTPQQSSGRTRSASPTKTATPSYVSPQQATTPPSESARVYTETITTTTIPIPLDSPEAKPVRRGRSPGPTGEPGTPGRFAQGATMTREEALEQIRQRRGRARSIAGGALTPRKQMVEGVERRDISAPGGAPKSAGPTTRRAR